MHLFAKSYTTTPFTEHTLLSPHRTYAPNPISNLHPLTLHTSYTDSESSGTLLNPHASYTELSHPTLHSYILCRSQPRSYIFIQNLYLLVVSTTYHELPSVVTKRLGWILTNVGKHNAQFGCHQQSTMLFLNHHHHHPATLTTQCCLTVLMHNIIIVHSKSSPSLSFADTHSRCHIAESNVVTK